MPGNIVKFLKGVIVILRCGSISFFFMAAPTKERNIQVWDGFSSLFASKLEPFTLPLSTSLISSLKLDTIEENDLVVEVGCGGGGASALCAFMLSGRGTLKSFDLSPKMVEIASQKVSNYSNASVSVGDAQNLPLEES